MTAKTQFMSIFKVFGLDEWESVGERRIPVGLMSGTSRILQSLLCIYASFALGIVEKPLECIAIGSLAVVAKGVHRLDRPMLVERLSHAAGLAEVAPQTGSTPGNRCAACSKHVADLDHFR